jgi:hypothetical protein
MGIVKALPDNHPTVARLELRNEHNQTVVVQRLTVGRVFAPFDPIALEPGERRIIDISSTVRGLFDPQDTKRQERTFAIRLDLEPEPPKQPAPGEYIASFENRVITDFRSHRG